MLPPMLFERKCAYLNLLPAIIHQTRLQCNPAHLGEDQAHGGANKLSGWVGG